MNDTVTVIIAILIAILTLSVIHKHVELKVQIRDLINVTLRATKNDEKEESP
ncbi:hypothetical protein HPY28_29750 [Brevibacillus sp. HB1.2]|uniref:hypothetical protein n=1 Tax=Brevibacillus sp. HB1.2 TaxID=2738807 RepID=UPI00157593F9|nr:hypothetical protein [Brevibacillus sp. HB1.2]NTU24499.1 hypothetical protein [Brevibacillus sp. HB1.2]